MGRGAAGRRRTLGVVHSPSVRRRAAAAPGSGPRSSPRPTAPGIYTQLVTSGVGLHEERLAALTAAGLRSVQLSVQHADPAASDRIAGARSFAAKERAAAGWYGRRACRSGLNVVLHRDNLDALDDLIELGLAWGAERIELANTQFYGWALRNRDRPAARPASSSPGPARRVERWRERLAAGLELVWVVPDYFDGVAKPCMGGWGALSLTVAPDGTVCPARRPPPCPAWTPPNVRDHSLEWIWRDSQAFNLYRGEEWMQDPCRSCELRTEDFGGCRCQAYALTGDAARTDPACRLSPDHAFVRDLVDRPRIPVPVAAPAYAYRKEGP